MKKISKLICLLLAFVSISILVVSCGEGTASSSSTEFIDYTSTLKLDLTSANTSKCEEVTVACFIDGDTTHFNVPSFSTTYKARYIAINTPESTGKIEPWGKAASNYTKSKLKDAYKIYIESDGANYEHDSTGERYLTWVWYQTDATSEIRCLNLEILQEGYAVGNNATSTKYATVCDLAITQARTNKLYVYSSDKDPDFPYGEAISVDCKELRTNIEDYNNKKVAFEALVTKIDAETAYVESYDAESEQSYGMQVYMGYTVFSMIKVGNVVRFVGTVTYYETGGVYQVSGLTYRATKPDYADNLKLISENNTVTPTEITGEQLLNDHSIIHTYVTIKGLQVDRTYTTTSTSDSNGAITLTCQSVDNKTVTIRTNKLYDSDGNVVTEAVFNNAIIDVIGIIDYYNGYQVKVISYKDITFK